MNKIGRRPLCAAGTSLRGGGARVDYFMDYMGGGVTGYSVDLFRRSEFANAQMATIVATRNISVASAGG